MAKPQLENGYTPVANELLDHICKFGLNGTQWNIVVSAWRFTYGFSRKEHSLSLGFLAEYTKTSKNSVKKELDRLIKMNILSVVQESTYHSTRVISFNKDYEMWKTLTETYTVQQMEYSNNCTVQQMEYSNNCTLEYNNCSTKKNNNKSNIYINHFDTFWKAYPKKVSKAVAEKSFAKLHVDESLLNDMILAIENQKATKQWKDKQFIPHPATWLNQRRWEDEVEVQGNGEERVTMTTDGVFKF